eukprot:Nk52_evm2s318 gene=Nk52_evmTU2s318
MISGDASELALLSAHGISDRRIIELSPVELAKITGISQERAEEFIHNAHMRICHSSVNQYLLGTEKLHRNGFLCSALELYSICSSDTQCLSTGCPQIDRVLGGVFRRGTIVDLSGNSSAGKTQMCLQLCLTSQLPTSLGGFAQGSLYICTESAFPSARLEQIIETGRFHHDRGTEEGDYEEKSPSDRIYIDHCGYAEDLEVILERKLPLLKDDIGLIVIDSITALFRGVYGLDEGVEKSSALYSIGALLKRIADRFNCCVVTVNQVSSGMNGEETVLPALGLTWSNSVNSRVMLVRSRKGDGSDSPERSMSLSFSPSIADEDSGVLIDLRQDGLHGV